jgi:hypothetical protein
MARDFQDIVREVVMSALENSGSRPDPSTNGGSSHRFSGMKGMVAGAGAAALVPLAVKNLGGIGGIAKHLGANGVKQATGAPGQALKSVTSNLGDSVGSSIGDKVTGKLDEAGGPSGILKDTLKDALPFGGGGDGGGNKGGIPGVGKGRRMPVQQSIDIGIPIETVYNQWTQFSEWPTFMHRVTRVTQEDDCTVSFATKIWGKTKEFSAQIETQRPNERIKWSVKEGMTHTGVVTFHELGPNLTRILLGLDVDPGGLIEKAARGMRHVKRAARADLHRFKAFIEMAEQETGAWRGVIEDGEVVEEHDPAYDEEREYSDIDDIVQSDENDDEDTGADEDEDEDEESQSDAEDESDDDAEEEAEAQPRPRRGRATSRASSEGAGSRTRSRGRQQGSRSTRGRGPAKASGGRKRSASSSKR